MKRNQWILLIVGLSLLLLIILVPLGFLAVNYFASSEPTAIGDLPTQPAETSVPATEILPTNAVPPTETDVPTATLTPTATDTPAPTASPLPTFTPTPVTPTLTPTPAIPCNWAQLVADVTIPDGTLLAPGLNFNKIWRLKNIGSCTWTTGFTFNFTSGTAMTVNNLTVALPATVKPGETVDIKIKLVSPTKAGIYIGYWMLKDKTGFQFGGGSLGDQPFDVNVQVLNVDPNTSFDFILRMCEATWRDSNGNKLPCPGTASGSAGFVYLLTKPAMEHRTENEPALWVNPDHRSDGKVSATYPSYFVQAGDHFLTWVGCLADSKGCNVTFELSRVKPNGNLDVIGTWTETFDGVVSVVDIDLSSLAGKDVVFVLSVAVNNDKWDKANAFWFAPRIVNE